MSVANILAQVVTAGPVVNILGLAATTQIPPAQHVVVDEIVVCNRGSATWQARAATGDTPGRRSGSLEFGALATTRAMCPPASLEPRLVKALPYVRSYVLMDGRLHLSLFADGGILVFAPAPRPPG